MIVAWSVQNDMSSQWLLQRVSCLVLLMFGIGLSPVSAQTLNDALAVAYENSPALVSARAAIDIAREQVVQARARMRPSIGATVNAERNWQGDPTGVQNTLAAALTLDWRVFQGFAAQNAVVGAELEVMAASAALRIQEQDLLLSVVVAYVDVLRDRALLALRTDDFDLAAQQLVATEARLAAGQGTRSEVVEAEGHKSLAEAALAVARANVDVSEAGYFRVVGNSAPRELAPASLAHGALPSSGAEATAAAIVEHPSILQAGYLLEAAGAQVDVQRGELGPTVELFGTIGANATGGDPLRAEATIGARVTIPLYGGGAGRATVREARLNETVAQSEVDFQRAQVMARVASAYAQLGAARAQLEAAETIVSVAQRSLDTARQELQAGLATASAVLEARRALLSARLNLENARHDEVVASYTALATIGRLDY